MKKPVFLGLALVALDQCIKLFIALLAMNSYTILIPGVLRFQPVQNTSLNWLASMAGVQTPVALMVAFQIIMLVLAMLLYRYLAFCSLKPRPSLWVFLAFAAAGICCSFIDVVFWGGSLDFLGLFNWFVFDTKDIFLNTSVAVFALWAIGFEKDKARGLAFAGGKDAFSKWLRMGCPLRNTEPEGR